MYTVQQVPKRSRKSMNAVLDRKVVNGNGLGAGVRRYPTRLVKVNRPSGLGELDGLFNIGKMFTRMFTFTPSSFKLSNIMGAIGSATTFGLTGGLSTLLPKVTGAHSALMKDVGMATTAVAAVAGAVVAAPLLGIGGAAAGAAAEAGTAATVATTAGETGMMAAGTGVLAPVEGVAAGSSFFTLPAFTATTGSGLMTAGAGVLAPVAESGGILSAIGSGIGNIGSGLMKILPNMFGGGGGVIQQQPQQYGPGAPTADQLAQQQAYDASVAAAQAAMYTPGGAANIPGVTTPYTGPVIDPMGQPGTMDTAYGDLKSPYTAISETDGSTIQVDPATGQPIATSSISTPMWIGGGAIVLLLGYYMMQGEEK